MRWDLSRCPTGHPFCDRSIRGTPHTRFSSHPAMSSTVRAMARLPAEVISRRLIMAVLDWTRPKDPPLSLGATSIIASLNHNNIPNLHRSWSVNAPDFNPDHVVDWVHKSAHDAHSDFAIGAFVWNERHVQTILTRLKEEKFKGRLIVGGPQVSYVTERVEQYYPQADVFVRGYAEDAMVAVMKLQKVRGVHFKGEFDLGFSTRTNLDTLKSPFMTGLVPAQRFIRWETQRGCPFKCSFCQHREPEQHEASELRRHFHAERVQLEAEWICANPVIQDIAVLDPTFNSGPGYLNVMDTLISGGYSGKLSLQCRLEMVKEVFLEKAEQMMKRNGATVVLEFGVQTIIKDEQCAINRLNNLKQAEVVLSECRRRGIPFEISLIFGLPRQTLESFKLSVAWAKSQSPTKLLAFPLMLLRGTPLYGDKARFGLVESTEYAFRETEDRQQFDIPHVVESDTFSYADWKEMACIAAKLDGE